MKPCGAILTFMNLRKWREWWFNLPLLAYHLTLFIAGTVYGKIKWPYDKSRWGWGVTILILNIPSVIILLDLGVYWYLPLNFLSVIIGLGEIRGIDWRRVWRAAQCSHVRLVLKKVEPIYAVMNFGYPKAEIQPWHEEWNDGKRFEYRDPAFEPSDEFVAAMIEYAEKQVGKGYDDLQLISSGLHLIAWIVMPWWWGKELRIIKALNRKGGREFCSSGFTADLRWAEAHSNNMRFKTFFDTDYFPGYDTPVVPPGLVALSEDWRRE